VAGDREKRAGQFITARSGRRRGSGGGMFGIKPELLSETAARLNRLTDPSVRDDLMRLRSLHEVARLMAQRTRGGERVDGAANLQKLLLSRIVRLSRDLGLRILGDAGTLHGYTEADKALLEGLTGIQTASTITEAALFSAAPSIYGGTDEIQKNIVGERVLGLPR
jgi:alkylation response protein AidB-like acyl-CoA dehydrogenase